MKPNYLDELINRAAKVAGSDSKLAELIDVSRQAVSDWRHGRKPCPPADVALMAELAGLDPEAWTARAVIQQHEGTKKGAKLEKALKKAALVTGAALASCGVIAGEQVGNLIRCINRKVGIDRKNLFCLNW